MDTTTAPTLAPCPPAYQATDTHREVSWSAVHAYVSDALAKFDHALPEVGTPEWHQADDRTKVAALLLAGERWALHRELHQSAVAAAAEDVREILPTVTRARESYAKVAAESPWCAPYGTRAHTDYLRRRTED